MATQTPGEDFPTVGTDIVIPGGDALFNMLFGPGFSTRYGNHQATFGRNPEIVGGLFPGGWYPNQSTNVPPGSGVRDPNAYGQTQSYGNAQGFTPGIGTTQSGGSDRIIPGGGRDNPNSPIGRPGGNPDYTTAGDFGTQHGGLMSSVIPALMAQQGGWGISSGPQGDYRYSSQWQPNLMNSVPIGMKAAYYGGGDRGMPGAVDSNGNPIQGSMDRFLDSEASYGRRYGTAVWQDSQGNDVPQGTPGAHKVLPSWEETAGLRGITQLGGYDPTGLGYGTAQTGSTSDIYKAQTDYRNKNPLAGMDPLYQLMQQRGVNQEGPAVADIVNAGQGGLGRVGQGGVDQTSTLNNQYTNALIQGIDTEASQGLTKKFQEQQAALEAAGLGSSGAGIRLQQQAQNEITSQANRDKQRVLADLTESNLQRQAQAINLATQGNIQGGLQGMNLNVDAAEAARQRLTGALQQGLDRQMQGGLQLGQQNLQALSAGDEAALNRQIQQANINHMGLQEFMGLQDTKDAMRSSRMNEMMSMEDRMRSYQQERLNQQIGAQMKPMDWLMQMITGVPSSSAGPVGRTNPWDAALAQGAGGIASGVGQYIANYGAARGNQLWGDTTGNPNNGGLYGD